jgi:hypothetical protein
MQKTPNKTGASGAAWSDAEKMSTPTSSKVTTFTSLLPPQIAYLIVLCENEGRVDAKIAVSHRISTAITSHWHTQTAPIPTGRSIVSCKKLLVRLKEKYKEDITKIKAGQALAAAPTSAGGEVAPEKPKTPRKRKAKVDAEDEDAKGTPKNKTGGRKEKGEATPVKEEVEVDSFDEELQV